MKILLDTNVLVSAVLSSGGHCSEIVDHAVHEHELYTTAFVTDELKKVFSEDFHSMGHPVGELLRFIEQFFILGETARQVDPICRDRNDDQLLADAAANGIDIFITGDKDLLDLKSHRGVRIISPKEYWSL